MRPFHTVAVPHQDILSGRLTMDVFAADLWEVSQKTYLTHGLENLLGIVEKRLAEREEIPSSRSRRPSAAERPTR
jgi:hypothetical protein